MAAEILLQLFLVSYSPAYLILIVLYCFLYLPLQSSQIFCLPPLHLAYSLECNRKSIFFFLFKLLLCLPHIAILLVTVIKPISTKALQIEFSNRNAFQSWYFLSPHIVDGLCLKNFVFPLSSQWAILSSLKYCKFLMMYGSEHFFSLFLPCL